MRKYCDEYVCVRQDISDTTRNTSFTIVCMLPMAVARSYCGVVAMLCASGFVDDIIVQIYQSSEIRVERFVVAHVVT